MKKQIDGEEIDIDAIVEGYADMKAGGRACEKLYTRLDKRERNVATAFLVDLSGSTTGWVIETEKEALVVLCEGLEKLGDKYAIYGFSGKTRRQCDFYVFKEFDEPYDEEIKARIAGMDAFDYTRMGPPIRHLTQKLRMVEARVKIMIILSDGKPEDFDEYKGKHGIEDTRKALVEAKQAGIKPFCITIDKEARGYIQRLFGDVGYVILNDIGKLPRRLPDIYKRLST
jgi:nitric oxide reductase NorD protein